MSEPLSRSEKKRRAKAVEDLAGELVDLPDKEIAQLPCDAAIRGEISLGRQLKGGARKRQVKYITKMLRDEPLDDLLQYLQEKKGSRLNQVKEQHEIEHTRDLFINEAIRLYEEPLTRESLLEQGQLYPEQPPLPAALSEELRRNFTDVDADEMWHLAWQFARTRKVNHSREIFRMLKAVRERQRFRDQSKMNNGQ